MFVFFVFFVLFLSFFNYLCSVIVVDPELREECVINGRMTITMNVHKELCGIQKSGMHKEGEMEGTGRRETEKKAGRGGGVEE